MSTFVNYFFVIPVELICQIYQKYIQWYEHYTDKNKTENNADEFYSEHCVHIPFIFTSCQFWPIQGKTVSLLLINQKRHFKLGFDHFKLISDSILLSSLSPNCPSSSFSSFQGQGPLFAIAVALATLSFGRYTSSRSPRLTWSPLLVQHMVQGAFHHFLLTFFSIFFISVSALKILKYIL